MLAAWFCLSDTPRQGSPSSKGGRGCGLCSADIFAASLDSWLHSHVRVSTPRYRLTSSKHSQLMPAAGASFIMFGTTPCTRATQSVRIAPSWFLCWWVSGCRGKTKKSINSLSHGEGCITFAVVLWIHPQHCVKSLTTPTLPASSSLFSTSGTGPVHPPVPALAQQLPGTGHESCRKLLR